MSPQVQESLTKALELSPGERADLSDSKITSVVEITESLFPESTIEVEMEADPSEPDFSFFVFKVNCSGEIEELISKETEWNRRVRAADSEYSAQLRLLICPVE